MVVSCCADAPEVSLERLFAVRIVLLCAMGCFDSDDMDVLYELISNKVDDLLKQASNKAGSIEAFLEKRNFREQIKNFVHSKSGRRPMIIFNISYVNGYSDDEYYGDV